jgi:hypothetical protein
MSTTQELAAFLRSVAPDFSFGGKLAEAATALDRLSAIESAGGDAEVLSIEAWLNAHPLNDEEDADDCFTFDYAKEAQDSLRTLLTLLKRARSERQGLIEGIRAYEVAYVEVVERFEETDIAARINQWHEQHGHLAGADK